MACIAAETSVHLLLTAPEGRTRLARLMVRSAVALGLLVVISCRSDSKAKDEQYYEHILPFDTATVRVAAAKDTTRLTVLLAESEEQRTLGLMERRSLAPNAGMLFLYSATQPPTPGCPDYPAGAPYRAALEANAGFFARNGIRAGDHLFLGDTAARRRGTSAARSGGNE